MFSLGNVLAMAHVVGTGRTGKVCGHAGSDGGDEARQVQYLVGLGHLVQQGDQDLLLS